MIYNIISTIILTIMSIILFVCGIKLWRHREETGDRSRAIHGLFCLFSSALALIFIFRTWNGTTVVDSAYLDPELIRE